MKRACGLAVLFFAVSVFTVPAFAQMVEVQDGSTADTGKAKAEQYFAAREKHQEVSRAPASNSAPHYFAIHVGSFFSDQAYKWGSHEQNNIGHLNIGVTYRLGEWVNSMDFVMRAEYMAYTLDDGSARKLSFLGMITFPDAHSQFPLYFGAGAGPGLFVKQVNARSPVSLDYELVAGARFFNVINSMGFMVETGVKNHFFVFSPGQFNGFFLNVGAIFTF